MSTRKLILTALACGIAILIAGSVQLLRLSSSDSNSAKVFTPGQSATVGDVVVSIQDVDGGSGLVDIRLEAANEGLLPEFPVDAWTQQTGNAVGSALIAASECGEVAAVDDGVRRDCQLGFAAERTGTSYIRFTRDGAVATWVIES